ncbi:hypothetical protein ACFL6G_02605 [candidate division KSB1 bacterium]
MTKAADLRFLFCHFDRSIDAVFLVDAEWRNLDAEYRFLHCR